MMEEDAATEQMKPEHTKLVPKFRSKEMKRSKLKRSMVITSSTLLSGPLQFVTWSKPEPHHKPSAVVTATASCSAFSSDSALLPPPIQTAVFSSPAAANQSAAVINPAGLMVVGFPRFPRFRLFFQVLK